MILVPRPRPGKAARQSLLHAGPAVFALSVLFVGQAASANSAHVPGRLLVRFVPSATNPQRESILHSMGAIAANEIPHTGAFIVDLATGVSEEGIAMLAVRPPCEAFTRIW